MYASISYFHYPMNSLLLDAWFSQIILTWSFPYLEMSAVYRRYSINANTTIDIVYIAQWLSTRLLSADWEVPSWTTVRVPCYYCHYLYGTHKDLSGPSIQTPSIYLFIYLAALVSWGWGQRGPKTTLPYIMFVKIICRCKKGSGVW